MNHTPDTTTAGNGGNFDPQQAAALLDQTTRQARRTFTPGPPLLWVFRAVFVLVAFGGFWLSVRGQDPYSGRPAAGPWPSSSRWWPSTSAGAPGRSSARAPASAGQPSAERRAWLGVMLVAWVAAYAVTAPLYHAGASHPVWGLYPASAPLLIIGLVGAATAAARRDWPMAGICLAIAIVAAAAGFGGPAGAWLIMGIGLCAVCLGTAAFTVWQQRRSMVRP